MGVGYDVLNVNAHVTHFFKIGDLVERKLFV